MSTSPVRSSFRVDPAVETRGKKKLLAAPQVSEIAVDISCPAVSEGVCSLSQVFLLFLLNTGIRMCNAVYESIECSSLLEITFVFCFLGLKEIGLFGW